MSQAFISFENSRQVQSLFFCDSQNLPASCETSHLHGIRRSTRLTNAKQPRHCMQRTRVVKIAAIVSNALRMRWHLDSSRVNATPLSVDRVARLGL